MTKDLDYAIRVIKATIQDHSPEVCYPYFFIVGAGISAPEIPIASEIIKKCKRKCEELDEISYIQFENEKRDVACSSHAGGATIPYATSVCGFCAC